MLITVYILTVPTALVLVRDVPVLHEFTYLISSIVGIILILELIIAVSVN